MTTCFLHALLAAADEVYAMAPVLAEDSVLLTLPFAGTYDRRVRIEPASCFTCASCACCGEDYFFFAPEFVEYLALALS
jgi:hypothetical protein